MAETKYDGLSDHAFWCLVLDDVAWLFYGDLDEHFATFVHHVFTHLEEIAGGGSSFGPFGFRSAGATMLPLSPDFSVAYWLFLSELIRMDLAEYGTSPRGAWLTSNGERFRRLFLAKFAADPGFDWREEWDDEAAEASLRPAASPPRTETTHD